MVVIEVKFDSSKKVYQYLFINPNKYKINKSKKLICTYGASNVGTIQKQLTAVKVYKVEQLPPIITSQIVLLDENNNIDIQRLGAVYTVPKVANQETPKTSSRESDAAAIIGVHVSKIIGKIFF